MFQDLTEGLLIIFFQNRKGFSSLTKFFAALTTLSLSVLAEILFRGMIVYLRCSSPFSNNFLPVTFKKHLKSKVIS